VHRDPRVHLLRLILRRWPEEGLQAETLLTGRHADQLKDFVVISATDGNRGQALAAAALTGLWADDVRSVPRHQPV